MVCAAKIQRLEGGGALPERDDVEPALGRLSDKLETTVGTALSLVSVADHVDAVRCVVLPGRKVAGAIQGLRPWRMVAAVARPRRR